MVAAQLHGVLDDHADASGELEVLEQEREAHERLSYERVTSADLPYPLPAEGGPVRVAFVGQRTYFEACSMAAPAAGVQPRFIDFRGGTETAPMLEQLQRFAPHAVVVFRPEIVPAGTFAQLPAPVLGFLTEPLPRPGGEPHPHLEYNLAELRKVDRGNVDRVICFDPNGWSAADALLPVWRSTPLPVADWVYRAPTPSRRPPRIIFIGFSTMHRETTILPLKHALDIPHYAHALMGRELREVLAASDVGINVHNDATLISFENRVLLHLAAGHLVVSEPLDPQFGLEPGLDYVHVGNPDDLRLRVHQIHRRPAAYDRIRIRGHHKSRQFRASHVWPRVIGDLFDDLAAFGTERALGAAA